MIPDNPIPTNARRFVLQVIGHAGELLSSRYLIQYQAIDKLAAVSIPQAEMLRIARETNGNTSAVLAPMQEALIKRGYDTLMVLPAQAAIVELKEIPPPGLGTTCVDELFERAKSVELKSAKLLLESMRLLEHVAGALERYKDPDAAMLRSRVDAVLREVAIDYVQKG